jgi:hypothetical protein
MILNGKTQLGLAFDKHMQEELIEMHYEKYIAWGSDPQLKVDSYRQVSDLLSDEGNKNYYFTNTAIEIASRIKLDKGKFEDLSFISDKLPVKKCTFLVGRHKFYRWYKWVDTGDVMVICVKLMPAGDDIKQEVHEVFKKFDGMSQYEIEQIITENRLSGRIGQKEHDVAMATLKNRNFVDHLTNGIFYYMWGIKSGKLSFPEDEKNEEFFDEMLEFVRLLIFTELSDLETVELRPSQSVGSRRQGKTLNESKNNVTIVDSTWNKILVRSDGFKVAGHLRLQPYGPGLQYRKLKFIEEFEKEGYTRNAKKENGN